MMLFLFIASAVFVGLCLFEIRLLIFAIILGLVLLAAALRT
jgi:hypothetical protein